MILPFPDQDMLPLCKKLPDGKWESFMFMASYPRHVPTIYTYKHHQTRRYLNIDTAGQCYAFRQGCYIPISDESAFSHAFS